MKTRIALLLGLLPFLSLSQTIWVDTASNNTSSTISRGIVILSGSDSTVLAEDWDPTQGTWVNSHTYSYKYTFTNGQISDLVKFRWNNSQERYVQDSSHISYSPYIRSDFTNTSLTWAILRYTYFNVDSFLTEWASSDTTFFGNGDTILPFTYSIESITRRIQTFDSKDSLIILYNSGSGWHDSITSSFIYDSYRHLLNRIDTTSSYSIYPGRMDTITNYIYTYTNPDHYRLLHIPTMMQSDDDYDHTIIEQNGIIIYDSIVYPSNSYNEVNTFLPNGSPLTSFHWSWSGSALDKKYWVQNLSLNLNEILLTKNVIVYPNPLSKGSALYVSDKIIMIHNINGKSTSNDPSQLCPGIYFLTLQSGHIQKLVVE